MTLQTKLFNNQDLDTEEFLSGNRTQILTKAGERQVIFGKIPSKSNRYRIFSFKRKNSDKSRAFMAKTQTSKKYESDFALQCTKYRNANISEEFILEVDVYFESKRSDLDNSLKMLLDCLQQVQAITNDNNCIEIHARKFIDKHTPRIEFTLKKAA